MLDDKLYRAHLQFLPENPYLCDSVDPEASSFVLPPTPVVSNMTLPPEPVVLLAKRGNCPFARKAAVAEAISKRVEFLLVYNNDLEGEDILVPMYSEYGESRLVLLSITHRAGWTLRYHLEEQSDFSRQQGGPLLAMDSKIPPNMMTAEDIQEMMARAIGVFFLLVSFSGCMMVFVGTLQQGSTPIIGPSMLTEEQVHALPRVPAGHTCAICLDESDEAEGGEEMLELPCEHHFHEDCILPWLTERQPKCPLCKYDVLQHITEGGVEGGGGGILPGLWARFTRFRWTYVQQGDEAHDGIMIEPQEMELTEQRDSGSGLSQHAPTMS